MRLFAAPSLALAAALALAGCQCGIEEAAQKATRGRADLDAKKPAEALKKLADAGSCVKDRAEDDLEARYLLAAIYFQMHLAGAPAALPSGDPALDWVREALQSSGERDFLALAFRMILSLEEQTFTVDRIPAWATVDRLLIAGDEVLARAEALVAMLPAEAFQKTTPQFAAAQMRLALLEAARGFFFQAWRRALEATETVEPARRRLTAVYTDSAEIWQQVAAAAAVDGVQALKRDAEKERNRFRALAERAAIVINPEDLEDPVEREMLKLVFAEHAKEGRLLATGGLDEAHAGNRDRAAAKMRAGMSHFILALTIGTGDEGDVRSALGYLKDLVVGLRDLAR